MIFIFKDNPERIKNIERKESESSQKLHSHVPDFCFGTDHLKRKRRGEDSLEFLKRYSRHWFSNLGRHITAPLEKVEIEWKRKYMIFPSVIDERKKVFCKYSMQKSGPGKKVALITVMHWNGIPKEYEALISFIRKRLLPVSTFLFIPSNRKTSWGTKESIDYESVGPDIGGMVSRFQKNIFDIQRLAWILKNELGFEEVGIFSFSMGTCYSSVATMGNPSLFDFAIFHLLADDFHKALMEGISTTRIAEKIKGGIEENDLHEILKILSPGAYEKKLKNLPKHTRIVQAKYDHIFCPENVIAINKKIRTIRHDIEIDMEPLGHNCLSSFPLGLKVLYNDIKFIYKYTGMKKHPMKRFFTS